MEKTTTVVPFRQVNSVDDPLTEIAREGARRMLAVAMGVEADAFVAQHSGVALPDGRQRVVRHGHGPMRGSRPGSAPWRCSGPRCATEPTGTPRPARSRPAPEKWAWWVSDADGDAWHGPRQQRSGPRPGLRPLQRHAAPPTLTQSDPVVGLRRGNRQ